MKNPIKPNKTQNNPIKPNKTQKSPVGWVFLIKPRVFSNPDFITCPEDNYHHCWHSSSMYLFSIPKVGNYYAKKVTKYVDYQARFLCYSKPRLDFHFVNREEGFWKSVVVSFDLSLVKINI